MLKNRAQISIEASLEGTGPATQPMGKHHVQLFTLLLGKHRLNEQLVVESPEDPTDPYGIFHLVDKATRGTDLSCALSFDDESSTDFPGFVPAEFICELYQLMYAIAVPSLPNTPIAIVSILKRVPNGWVHRYELDDTQPLPSWADILTMLR